MIRCALPERRNAARVDAAALEHVELVEQHHGVDHHTVADDRRHPRVEHAARHELELEHLAVDHERVAGVVPALVAHDHRRLFGEVVGELALALVAPLGADDHCAGHKRLHVTLPPGRPLFGVTLGKWYSTAFASCSGFRLYAAGMVEMNTPVGSVERRCHRIGRHRGSRVPRHSVRDRGALRRRRSAVTTLDRNSRRDGVRRRPRRNPMGGPLDGLVPGSFRGDTDEHACLTLNVWAPAGTASRRGRCSCGIPGGAFTIGAASQPAYDGNPVLRGTRRRGRHVQLPARRARLS